MRQSDIAARAQDTARTKYSNKSLATGRRSRPADRTQLHTEQNEYRRRFSTPPTAHTIIIKDVDGNYPDHTWTPPR